MLGLPTSTEFNHRIAKQKFYENLTVTPALRRVFTEQIKGIWWRNKLAPTTLNIGAGSQVTELEVIEIQLNQPSLDEAVLRQIDKEIPYHILFVLTFGEQAQAWIGYKEASASDASAFKVNRYFHTDWMDSAQCTVELNGLTTDAVYEHLVRQIAGDSLTASGGTLRESVDHSARIAELEKRIAALQVKIRREKQLNRQMEMNAELKRLKSELEALIQGNDK